MASILLLAECSHQGQLYQMELEDAGHRVQALDNLNEVIDQIESDPPDLVVLNPHLVKCRILWMLTVVKEKAPDLPLILYTSESLFDNDYRYFLADACLTRHSDTTELLHIVDRFVNGAKTRSVARPKARAI